MVLVGTFEGPRIGYCVIFCLIRCERHMFQLIITLTFVMADSGTSITMMQLHQFNPASARFDRNRQAINQQRPKVNHSVAGSAGRRSQREEDIFA